ncbi:MAG: OsmC family protein [Bryobacterales bacterium]|nr:OsmC family protein [Bryobacterales bacterium]
MSDIVNEFTIQVRQIEDYQFLVEFDRESMGALRTDEGAPLGKDTGPSPARMLAASIGNCLAASLLFASKKAGLALGPIEASVKVQMVRNEKKRIRIGKVEVTLDPKLSPDDLEKARGPRGMFEDFCTVTQSVQQGIPVAVKVKGIDGE